MKLGKVNIKFECSRCGYLYPEKTKFYKCYTRECPAKERDEKKLLEIKNETIN